jgi:ATP-dependent Clp protease adaptor protein ClpS
MSKNRPHEDQDGGVATATRAEKKLKKPPLYKVLLHNDDYTTRDFVVFVLQTVFHHDESSAIRVMWHVHTTGVGVAGVYSYEVAETKVQKVESMAKARDFPLKLSVEPEE